MQRISFDVLPVPSCDPKVSRSGRPVERSEKTVAARRAETTVAESISLSTSVTPVSSARKIIAASVAPRAS